MRVLRTAILLAALLLSVGAAETATASWQLYVSGEFGYSIGVGKVSGTATLPVIPADLGGEDDDTSALIAGTFGVQMPMSELTPWRLPFDWRWPDWPVRLELEFAGLREYEFVTPGEFPGTPLDDPFHTTATSWSMMNNVWLDIPLSGLYRPITSTTRVMSGRQRLPGLREFLRSSSVHLGVGIGLANLAVTTSDATLSGASNDYNFAWQVGTGFGHQLTDRVNLGFGYRFFRPGASNVILRGNLGGEFGNFRLAPDVHELKFLVRVLLYDLRSPWR